MEKVSNILDHNAFNLKAFETLETGVSELVKTRLSTVGPTTMLFYQKPLHIVKGEGVWLYDNNGDKYLDVYNNVPSVGHCHPKVTEAITDQLKQLNIHTRYLHESVHKYAERLLSTMPDSIDRLVMTCTGSESNDFALRLARKFTQKQGIIVTEAAYHGNTHAVTEVSPSALKKGQLPDYIVTVPIDNLVNTTKSAEDTFYDSVQEAIRLLDKRGYGCAAILVDSIFSSDGVYSHPKGFLKKAVELVKHQGGLLIADEVQPGFGRTGDAMWGFQRHNVIPDIVTMGKPMGNGYPVAGVASRLDLLEMLVEDAGYFNTFGGSPVAASAAIAVLDVISDEGLIENSLEVGHYLKEGLISLKDKISAITDVRGAGLFIGVDFCREGNIETPDSVLASEIMNDLREHGVLIGGAGKHGNTLKVRPPMCFTKENADLFLSKIEKSLSKFC